MQLVAIIFDMDGVLIDSVGLNWNAYNLVLSEYGVHVPENDIHIFVGRSLRDQVSALNEAYHVDINYNYFLQRTNEVKKSLSNELRPMPGAENLLKSLAETGHKMVVGTSSDKKGAIKKLSLIGLDTYFEEIVTQDDVNNHKPQPDVFIECARRISYAPDECIVIEDAPNGVLAAHNAGMKCVAIKTPYVNAVELESADYLASSLGDITPALLNSLTG